MKKIRKKDKYFLKMLEAESEHRSQQTGDQDTEPFITPVLFSILDALNRISVLLCIIGSAIFTILFLRL